MRTHPKSSESWKKRGLTSIRWTMDAANTFDGGDGGNRELDFADDWTGGSVKRLADGNLKIMEWSFGRFSMLQLARDLSSVVEN